MRNAIVACGCELEVRNAIVASKVHVHAVYQLIHLVHFAIPVTICDAGVHSDVPLASEVRNPTHGPLNEPIHIYSR
jgi:hypothetical protein